MKKKKAAAAEMQYDKLLSMVNDFKKKRILVIGDVMLDEYVWGSATRISPEAPVPVVEVQNRTFNPGGAANTVSNILALGAKASLLGLVGRDRNAKLLKSILDESGINTDLLMPVGGRPTTTKVRIVAQGQQVMRADQEDASPASPALAKQMLKKVESVIGKIDGVAVSDYCKGVINPAFMAGLLPMVRERNIPICVDIKPVNMPLFKGVSLVKPNRVEAEALTGIKIRDEESLREAGGTLLRIMGAGVVVITLGADGMAVFGSGYEILHIPSVSTQVYDVTGAGDTVLSSLALSMSCGHDISDAVHLANFAAGLVVRKRGTATVSAEELSMFLKGVC